MLEVDIVYEVDRNQCVTMSSLRRANERLSIENLGLDRRLDSATEQIVLLKHTIEEQERMLWQFEEALRGTHE